MANSKLDHKSAVIIEFSTPNFYIFDSNRSFLDILQQFNLLRILELGVFGPLFLRINGRH